MNDGFDQLAKGLAQSVGCIPMLSVTERAVHGASMSPAPRLWLNTPNSLACSRRGGLKAALPGADNSRMHCNPSRRPHFP